MKQPTLLLLCAVALVSCGESDAEKKARIGEEQETRHQVALAMPNDHMSLYLINQAETRCQIHPIPECADIATLRQDIANAVASCEGNTSRLCQLLTSPAQHQPEDFAKLPTGIKTPLPSSPFYWGLGNPILDRYDPKIGYRGEVSKQWLQTNRITLLAVVAALLVLLLTYAGKLLHDTHKTKKLIALQRQQRAEEKAKYDEFIQEREAERQMAAKAAAEETQRMTQEQQRQKQARCEAEQNAAAEQEKIEAEEQEDMDELAAIFREAFKGVK